jgi:hypothetical protein
LVLEVILVCVRHTTPVRERFSFECPSDPSVNAS